MTPEAAKFIRNSVTRIAEELPSFDDIEAAEIAHRETKYIGMDLAGILVDRHGWTAERAENAAAAI